MIGQAVLDYLMADRYDPIYGQMYPALNVIDNPDLEVRCKVRNAPKVIYAIKGNSKFNNDTCLALRAGFQNGYINLLVSEIDNDEIFTKIKGFSKLSDIQKSKIKLPYAQTSFLINELINLTHDVSNGLIKVKERTGMRKDRYSSCQYGYYVVQELSRKLKPKNENDDLLKMMTIRPARRVGHF